MYRIYTSRMKECSKWKLWEGDVNGCWVERMGCCIDARSKTTCNRLNTRCKCMHLLEEDGCSRGIRNILRANNGCFQSFSGIESLYLNG